MIIDLSLGDKNVHLIITKKDTNANIMINYFKVFSLFSPKGMKKFFWKIHCYYFFFLGNIPWIIGLKILSYQCLTIIREDQGIGGLAPTFFSFGG